MRTSHRFRSIARRALTMSCVVAVSGCQATRMVPAAPIPASGPIEIEGWPPIYQPELVAPDTIAGFVITEAGDSVDVRVPYLVEERYISGKRSAAAVGGVALTMVVVTAVAVVALLSSW